MVEAEGERPVQIQDECIKIGVPGGKTSSVVEDFQSCVIIHDAKIRTGNFFPFGFLPSQATQLRLFENLSLSWMWLKQVPAWARGMNQVTLFVVRSD